MPETMEQIADLAGLCGCEMRALTLVCVSYGSDRKRLLSDPIVVSGQGKCRRALPWPAWLDEGLLADARCVLGLCSNRIAGKRPPSSGRGPGPARGVTAEEMAADWLECLCGRPVEASWMRVGVVEGEGAAEPEDVAALIRSLGGVLERLPERAVAGASEGK